jgi:hypothetical protein
VRGNFVEQPHFRVVLFLKKNVNDADFENPLATECNGLVAEYTGHQWKALAIPPANCTKARISMAQVNKFYQAQKYHIYEVLDATMINMYHYDGAWRISTCKGYDVTNFQFTESHSYMQLFLQIAAARYPKFELSSLDPQCSYTFAMRSPEFHLFDETKCAQYHRHASNDYLRLIKIVDLSTLAEIDTARSNITIPSYQPVEVKNAHSLSTLLNYAKHAYGKYAKSAETGNFKFKPLYGYLLRSTSNAVPRAYRNIMLTSSLFAIIKQGLYSKSFDTVEQMVVGMFVDKRRKEQFKVLFDQYAPIFSRLEALTDSISREVGALLTVRSHDDTTSHPLAVTIAHQFRKTPGMYQMAPEAIASAVYDYLQSPDYEPELNALLIHD